LCILRFYFFNSFYALRTLLFHFTYHTSIKSFARSLRNQQICAVDGFHRALDGSTAMISDSTLIHAFLAPTKGNGEGRLCKFTGVYSAGPCLTACVFICVCVCVRICVCMYMCMCMCVYVYALHLIPHGLCVAISFFLANPRTPAAHPCSAAPSLHARTPIWVCRMLLSAYEDCRRDLEAFNEGHSGGEQAKVV
jgi:hypothetical protein